jgi:ankyrin repeat protein
MVLPPTASIPNKSQAPLISSQSESLPRPPLRPPIPSSANSQTNLNQSGIMSARMQSSSSTSSSSSVDKNHPNTISDKSILPLPPSLPPQKSKNKSTSITILPSDINSSSGAFATAMAGGDQLASFLKILEMGGGNGGTHTSNASVSSFEKQQRLTSGGGGNNSGGGSSGDDVSGIALAAACEAIGDTMGVQTRNTWQPILLHIHSKRLWRRTVNSNFTAMSFHLANLNVKRGSAQYTALHYACLSLARLASQFVRERGGGESLKDKGKESREGEIQEIQSVTSLALRQASGLVTLLVAAGADVNARILESAGGQTPLHFLCSVGYPKLPEDILSKETASALFFAEECLCRAADAMIFAGVDANVKDVEYSQTPLHLSCRNGHPKLSAVLVAHGAKTDLEDRFMDSPIDCAEDNLRVIHAITKQKELQTKHCAGNGIGGEHHRSSTRTVFDDLVIKSSPMNGSPHLLMHILSFLYEKGPGKEAIVEADALLSQSTVPMNALTSLQYSLLEGPAKRALFVEGKLARDDTESSAWSMAAMLLIPPQKKSSGQVEVSIKRPPLIATRGKRSGSLGSSR